jgi:hypothetical protein
LSKFVRARIRFLTTAEGGRNTPPRTGIKPQLKLGHIYTSCVIRALSGDQGELELGKEHEVQLELLFWEHYSDLWRDTGKCELYEGSHLIALGRFLGDQ